MNLSLLRHLARSGRARACLGRDHHVLGGRARLVSVAVAGALATATLTGAAAPSTANLAGGTAPLSGATTASTARVANVVTPGSFTGYGFDQCATPSQAAMDAWLTSSPYWAVGVYIAGDNRACKDPRTNQKHLTATWVSTQLARGWRILPITVGPQASCYVNPKKKDRISAVATGDYSAARTQGRLEAQDTVGAAQALGIVPGSTLWYDLEHFDVTNRHCRESALRFLSDWTDELHRRGYVSGVYSGASSGIWMLDQAAATRAGQFTMPDYLWIARWDGRATVAVDAQYIRPDSWMPHRRVHQYLGDHDETHGGVRINIDSNYMSLGRGTRPGKAPTYCNVRVDFPRYRALARGVRHPQVAAAQCLLRTHAGYPGKVTGTFSRPTLRAVARFQATHGLPADGRMTRRTWTALLAKGPAPLVKVGSGGNAVRRVQRAVNAAAGAGVSVTGIFDGATTRAVRDYQARRGLSRTGVVDATTWAELRRGRR